MSARQNAGLTSPFCCTRKWAILPTCGGWGDGRGDGAIRTGAPLSPHRPSDLADPLNCGSERGKGTTRTELCRREGEQEEKEASPWKEQPSWPPIHPLSPPCCC